MHKYSIMPVNLCALCYPIHDAIHQLGVLTVIMTLMFVRLTFHFAIFRTCVGLCFLALAACAGLKTPASEDLDDPARKKLPYHAPFGASGGKESPGNEHRQTEEVQNRLNSKPSHRIPAASQC